MIKAKVSTDYKDIDRIFAGGSIQKEILKVWSTEADAYVFEAWRILEMEGPLPLTLKANGEPLIDYLIYGNTVQNGTPTPENPVDVVGCGERTAQLFDENYADISHTIQYRPIYVGSGYVILSTTDPYDLNVANIFLLSGSVTSGASTPNNGAWFKHPVTAQSVDGYVTVAYRHYNNTTSPAECETMLNLGSTALPYEPYGYKLPMVSNSTEIDIYLGESQTTRRIKKLVLDGTENWITSVTAGGDNAFRINFSPRAKNQSSAISSHYINRVYDGTRFFIGSGLYAMFFVDGSYETLADWKSYLAAQYAAGTPVTVWYVLTEPETGIVNEPLMKIGDYADTIDSTQANVQIPTSKGTTTIDYDGEDHFITSDGYELVDENQNGFLLSGSTLRPSKMYIKYKGR